ncbi:50S ribosomal protein L28 [Candidatus Collierbacteria bacterium]|nr:50S ribosomal protein L28 [Candidatus Collierbacteria bacterium]
MSLTCDSCGKGYQRGHSVSHAKNRHLRIFKPNLHRHLGRLLCTRCIKKSKNQPAGKEQDKNERQGM